MQRAIERVRGFRDLEAAQYRRADAAIRSLMATFELADFQPIDVPVVEHLDLYLRKNGAQVVPTIYSFLDQGKREVALRPEFTASVIRALASRVGTAVPTRVAYAGPVFRYEKPQLATGRQFTQAGVELLGDSSPLADAELLFLACQGALRLGLTSLRLVVGHLSPLRALLAYLHVDGYAEHYLLEHLEYFNRGATQQQAVRRRLGLLSADLPESRDEDEVLAQSLADAVHDASPEEARRLIAAILDQTGFDLTGSTRPPDEIIDRVVAKARRRAAQRSGRWREDLERALAFVEHLGALRGAPSETLARTEALLARYDVPSETLDELKQVLEALEAYDLQNVEVELAPGMARGIAYYSGLMFELYAEAPSPAGGTVPLQICGGGRYDGLAQALTGRGFPALGFAFGVERLLHALQEPEPPQAGPRRVAVILLDECRRAEAQRLALRVRGQSISCAVYSSSRSPARAIESARQAGYVAAIIVGRDGAGPQLYSLDDGALGQDTWTRLGLLPEGAPAPSRAVAVGEGASG